MKMIQRRSRASLYRQLRADAVLVLFFALVGACFELVDSGAVTYWGPTIGIVLAVVLATVERSRVARRLRSLSFVPSVLSRAVVNIIAIVVPFAGLGLLGGAIRGLEMSDFIEWTTSWEFLQRVLLAFGMYIVLLFVRDLDRLLGPGILVRYVTGRYHRPRQEERIFMFLDMKGSTGVAESLSPETYYGLLNSFFRDLSGPVIDSSAEIYQYVGDEVVLTWTLRDGIRNANCLTVFFDFDRVLKKKTDSYQSRFGVTPEYKAGVHLGRVIAAEIGDLSKDVVYNGDVLNTASRIQAACNDLGERLVASTALIKRLQLPYWLKAYELGPVTLKGKAQPVELSAVRRATEQPLPDYASAPKTATP